MATKTTDNTNLEPSPRGSQTDIRPAGPAAPALSPEITVDNKGEIDLVEKMQDKDAIGDDVIMKSPFDDMNIRQTWSTFRKASFMCLFAAFSAAADGYQIAMTGSIVANAGFVLQYGEGVNAAGRVILRPDHLAAWGGVQSMGQGLGMLTQHFIADRFGRKKSFYTLWVSLVIAVALQSFGRNWKTWLVAKIFSGFGVGSVQFMTGMYVTEIAPVRIRGFLLIFYSFWYGLGQLAASLALKVNNDRTPLNYLTPIYTEWAVIGIMAAIYLVIPETPYWCAARGRHEQGKKIIRFLNGKIEGYDVDFHYDLIQRAVEKEVSYQKQIDGDGKGFLQEIYNVKEVLTGVNGFRTLIAFWPAATQQMAGLAVNACLTPQLSTYSSYFASIVGFADPFLFSLLLSLVALLCTVIEASLIDVIGRRNLFLIGAVGVWTMCMTVGFMDLAPNKTQPINNLTMFFSLVWRVASTLLGNLGWTFVAETGSSRLRAKTGGIAAAGGVCLGLVFNTATPYMINESGANLRLKTAFVYGGLSFPLVVASFFLIPDMSRRTPAELDEMFRKKIRPWKFRSYVTDAKKALEAEKARTGETDPSRLQQNSAERY